MITDVTRFPLLGPSDTPSYLFPNYMPRSVEARHEVGYVVERIKHRLVDRRPYCGGFTQRERWKDGLSGRAGVEWGLSPAGVLFVGSALGCYC